MTDKTIYEQMEELHKKISYHARIYFVENREEIPNHEYDALEEKWNLLAGEHPEVAELFEFYDKPVPIHEPDGVLLKSVKLNTVMLSLAKALNYDAVEAFLKRFEPDTAFVWEVKLDGIALELRYIKGKLSQIVTRGAGMVGEDVTHALPLFRSIPHELYSNRVIPEELNIRGEAFIVIADYENYQELTLKKKSNPRNAVSGWIRAGADSQDSLVTDLLEFAAYWSSDDLNAENYEQLRDSLEAIGFNTPPLATLVAVRENHRTNLVPNDGIVGKVSDFALQRKAGVNNKHPRWAIAYKYPPEECFPSITDIEWNTTKTGRVVPVGLYSPMRVGGVVCQRTLLDNYKTFMALELRKGSVVSITRNNDVIPRLNRVVERGKGKLFKAPTECPSCDYVLEVRTGKDSADLVCNNVSGCPAQLTLRVVALADKYGLDIDGLGPAMAADLVDREMIKIPADIFRLTNFGLIPERVRLNIEAAKKCTIHRFIKALGLPDVGVVLAKRIGNVIPADAIEVSLLDIRFLTSIKGISLGTAMKIVHAFDDASFEENFMAMIDTLTIEHFVIPEGGMKVCVTGSLGQARETLIDYFAAEDIELTDKLTKDCQYVIVGEKPGQSKLLKATELGITTLNANEYSSVDKIIAFIKGN